jgi:site-specific DNA-methyltransferase (adenine-specific)
MLAFSGNRTHHRLFAGVEDAGFEVRDTVTWHYGSGFPKALDVGKAIDKAAGAERDVVGIRNDGVGNTDESIHSHEGLAVSRETEYEETAPATEAAKKWDGWKTALKPATEYVVVARKPFEGTVAENVQKHGTGALNIEACRVGTDVDTSRANSGKIGDGVKYSEAPNPNMTAGSETGGRYPANVVFDETEAERLGDKSRYFYTSKAKKSERTFDGKVENKHPTVKPVDLIEWLVKLVSAEEQRVLDPFGGSGTTGIACWNLGRNCVLIERDTDHAKLARKRIEANKERNTGVGTEPTHDKTSAADW